MLKSTRDILEHTQNITLHAQLIDAATTGDIKAIRRIFLQSTNRMNLLKSGDSEGRTALHIAAMHNHSMIIEDLIRRGANVNATDKVFFFHSYQNVIPIKMCTEALDTSYTY